MAEHKKKKAKSPFDIPMSIMVDSDIRSIVDDLATRYEVTDSAIVRRCLRVYLPKLGDNLNKHGWRATAPSVK